MTQRRTPRIAVVGATGMVGRTMIKILRERGHPASALRLVASGRSAGSEVLVDGQHLRIVESTPDAFDGIDIALFSAGADVSRALAPEAVARGTTVIDNSSAWRMEPDVPLVVSQVNADDLEAHEGVVANPNCSTMQLAPILMALRDSVGLVRVIVDTYQSVSGTGSPAVAELESQLEDHALARAAELYPTKRLQKAGAAARDEPKAPTVYPHRIAFNALPEIDVFRDDGYTQEEWKVVAESRKILHLPELAVSCTAVRVPVFVSHSEAVHVETRDPITPAEARRLFAAVTGVVVRDDPATHAYPLATDAEGTDDILVGRIRQDTSLPGHRGLALWIVADNLRVGAATNAVQLAEVLVARDWILPRSRRGRAAGAPARGPASPGAGAAPAAAAR
jgi:aspartate-semialdehyde dehydrogenase